MMEIAHRLENGSNGEDRLFVEQSSRRALTIISDGAGGIGGGKFAAEMTCSLAAQIMRTVNHGTPALWERCLRDVDLALAHSGTGGQCTAVIADISENVITGASVGDSGAWMLVAGEVLDLTEHQHRKPLLGSGAASPIGFSAPLVSGRLLLATDGLFKYASRGDIAKRAMGLSLSDAVDALVAGLRLRSGAFQDDIAIILIEHL